MLLRKINYPTRLAVLLLTVLTLSCSSGSDMVVLKLGHGMDSSHPVHKGMVHMAELVNEKSNGEMRIDIYTNEQLGTERETLELLQIGSLDLTKVSSAVMESFTPLYSIFGVPFLFVNDEHKYNVLDGPIGQRILQAGEPFRIVGLCYYDAGTRSFYTNDRPIRTPEDLRGMSIRVQESATAIRMINTLGGSATPISWGELYTALQQGVVGGAENNLPSFYLSRHYEVSKYLSMNEHTAPPDIMLISQHTWENVLNEEQRGIVMEAARESVPYQRQLWQEASREALLAIEAAGIEVVYPDREPFMQASQPFYDNLKSQPELHELMLEIQEAGLEFIN